ncbi:uncharacterized protein K02A2.6-like [Ixodes scapularis]|uniref:uncharacterized protein K02A2.6-like n=1 Tax=Ixodes scapularis TaxID=6945 RepID=UPI001AD66C5C|nr:uncharacterized protein K02A2.6-like [Ixodes scapularis]
MRRGDIQRALFAEDKTLTFQKAVDRAVALETAIKSTFEVHGSGGNSDQVESASVHKLKGDKEDTKKRGERKPQGRKKSLKTLTVTKDAHVNRITAPKDQPLTVEVLVENSPVTMEIDTGAAVSVISKQQYRKRFAALNLKPTALRLKTYTGETVKPCGVLEVKVSHQEETRVLPLYVLNQSGPPLLGREWLQRLRLNWKSVTGFNNLQRSTQGASPMPVDKLQVLLDRYQAIFKDELGKISGVEGMPETLVSDNGTQFTSNEFKDFLKRIGTRHVLTAPYHPSSNGLAERFVQTLKSALRKGVASEPLQQTLGKFLQTYRNIPHATTGEAPAVLFLGRRLRTRLDVLKPSVENRVARHQFRQILQRSCRTREFKLKDRVRVWNPHRGDKWLKATILSRSGPVSYKLRVYRDHDTVIWRRHQDHIRQEGDQEVGTPASQEEDGASFIPQALSTASQAQPPPASPPTSASTDPGSTSISRPRTPTQRYPTRVRCPPDRYSPGD